MSRTFSGLHRLHCDVSSSHSADSVRATLSLEVSSSTRPAMVPTGSHRDPLTFLVRQIQPYFTTDRFATRSLKQAPARYICTLVSKEVLCTSHSKHGFFFPPARSRVKSKQVVDRCTSHTTQKPRRLPREQQCVLGWQMFWFFAPSVQQQSLNGRRPNKPTSRQAEGPKAPRATGRKDKGPSRWDSRLWAERP